MSYTGVWKRGPRQEFTPCYALATASYGHVMQYSFPAGVPGHYSGKSQDDGVDDQNLGYHARPAWSKGLRYEHPVVGVMWNHGADLMPNRVGMCISAGVVPRVYVDLRQHDLAGNTFGSISQDLSPNYPLGCPNAGTYGGTITFDAGVAWPRFHYYRIDDIGDLSVLPYMNTTGSVILGDSDYLLSQTMMCSMDSLSAGSTGSVRAFCRNYW